MQVVEIACEHVAGGRSGEPRTQSWETPMFKGPSEKSGVQEADPEGQARKGGEPGSAESQEGGSAQKSQREEKGYVNTTCMSSEAGGENRVSFPLKPYISMSPCLFFQMSRKDANIGAVLHSLRREPHIA